MTHRLLSQTFFACSCRTGTLARASSCNIIILNTDRTRIRIRVSARMRSRISIGSDISSNCLTSTCEGGPSGRSGRGVRQASTKCRHQTHHAGCCCRISDSLEAGVLGACKALLHQPRRKQLHSLAHRCVHRPQATLKISASGRSPFRVVAARPSCASCKGMGELKWVSP